MAGYVFSVCTADQTSKIKRVNTFSSLRKGESGSWRARLQLPRTMQNHQDPSKPRTSTTCSGSNLGTLPVLLRFEALTGIACNRDRPAHASVSIFLCYQRWQPQARQVSRAAGSCMSHVLFFLQGEGKPGVGLQVGIFLDGATALLPAFLSANTGGTLRVSCTCYGGLREKKTRALLRGLESLVLALLWRQHRVFRLALACSIQAHAADWRGHRIPHCAFALKALLFRVARAIRHVGKLLLRCDEGLCVAHATERGNGKTVFKLTTLETRTHNRLYRNGLGESREKIQVDPLNILKFFQVRKL
jgi:hypothetical protein